MMENTENRMQMLNEISVLDFAVYDLTLFLDTHPEDMEGKEYCKHFTKALVQKQREFAMKYYPLMQIFCEDNKDWCWESGPLPWEGGCK